MACIQFHRFLPEDSELRKNDGVQVLDSSNSQANVMAVKWWHRCGRSGVGLAEMDSCFGLGNLMVLTH